MKKAAKISLISLAIAVPAAGIGTAIGLMFSLKNKGQSVVVTENDKKLVDQINNFTKQLQYETMSLMLADLLEEEEIDLQTQPLETSGVQFVWDSEPNEAGEQTVFLMKNDGSVAYAPAGYTINKNKSKLWKMVGSSTTRLMSTQNAAKVDDFDPNCLYSQFLRDDAEFDKDLTFCSGLDTGIHTGFNLTFNKDSGQDKTPVVINTYQSNLTVESDISDVHHYGSLLTLTVNTLPEDGTYEEYGTVEARVVLKDGTLEAKSGSTINDIVIESDDVKKVVVEADSNVGSVYATTDVSESTESFVEVETGATAPEIEDEKQTPGADTWYYAGRGTKEYPFVISTPAQLVHAQQDVNGTQETPEAPQPTLCFKLLNDVNLGGIEWTPIGNTSDNAYQGVFDGNGFTISNFKITTLSNSGVGYGLFGWTKGTANSSFQSIDSIWSEDNKLIEENIAEEKYSTVIKNVVVDQLNIQLGGESRCIGSIVGVAQNTYIYNCQIKTGTIDGFKTIGGITGSAAGSVLKLCEAGDEEGTLTIHASSYNIGGMIGRTEDKASISATNIAIIKCATGSNCTISMDQSENASGYIGGFTAYAEYQNTLAIEGSVNNATVESKGIPTDGEIAGFTGHGNHVSLIANSVNNGKVTVTGSAKVKNAGGFISTPGMGTKLCNCVNYGEIVANATNSVAGVAAGCDQAGLPTHVEDQMFEMNSCWNESQTISNPLDETKKSDICDKIVGLKFTNTTFANVDELNNIIKNVGSTKTQLTFKNCTLTDPSGSITLPSNISTIYADKPICENITVNSNFSQINVYVPNQNITVTEQSDCVLYAYGANNKITIAENASVKSVYALGEGSEIVNNGTVKRTIGLDNTAKKATNNGTCANIRFGRCESYYQYLASAEMTFINNGTITGLADASESVNDVITIYQGFTDPLITIKNYGTIKYQNNGLATPAKLISFTRHEYGYTLGGNLQLECYENSKIISDHQNFFQTTGGDDQRSKALLKWKEGYKVYEDGGTTPTTFDDIKTYYENAGTTLKITVAEMQ